MALAAKVKEAFVVNSLDSPDARTQNECILREKGCTAFRHEIAYSPVSDEVLLQSTGYVVEDGFW